LLGEVFREIRDKEIRAATSLVDYIFRRLAKEYLSFEEQLELGLASLDDMVISNEQATLPIDSISSDQPGESTSESAVHEEPLQVPETDKVVGVEEPKDKIVNVVSDASAPLCSNCGNITQRSGSCYVCTSCGSTTGCS